MEDDNANLGFGRGLGRSEPAAVVLGVDSSRPSRPTTNLNVDAVAEFGEFGCGDREAGKVGGGWS